ncbi:MAG: bL28 family ribosomal protein [bacterium]
MGRCLICKKSAASGNTISHSQIHTKRKFKPNLQKVNGMLLCTKCLKTIKNTTNALISSVEAEKSAE